MMLGYVHKMTMIYRIWDLSGRGRTIDSSNVYFIENQNAWTDRSDDPPKGESPFPEDDTSDLIDNQEHDNDMMQEGQDTLPPSRDSFVTPTNGECQPLGESMTARQRNAETLPNESQSKPQNPEAHR